MKLTQEQIDDLRDSCRSDSSKIIEYMEEKENQRKSHDRFQTILIILTFSITLLTFLINELPQVLNWLSKLSE